MTDAIDQNGSPMKGEGLLLNAVCVVMAILFLGLAGLSFLNAGNFISTDNLFFITVAGMMALIFLLVPLASLRAAKKEKSAATAQLASGTQARGAVAGGRGAAKALPTPVRYADAVDAKGRRIPPDVARMVEIIKDR